MNLKQKNRLGIAFSETDVKIVDISFSSDGDYTIQRRAEITRETRDDINLATAIKRVLTDEGFTSRHAAISLDETDVFLKKVSVPKLSKADIKKFLIREIKKGFGSAEKDFYFDYTVLNENTEYGVKKMEIAYLAAPKALVNRYTDIIALADLVPVIMVPPSKAMIHLMSHFMNETKENGEGTQETPVSYIFLGREKTHIAIAEKGQIIFSRAIHLTLQSGSGLGESNNPLFDDAIREIKRTLLYCKKDVLGKSVGKIIVASEQGLTPDLAGKLQEKLGIETILWHLNKPAAHSQQDRRPETVHQEEALQKLEEPTQENIGKPAEGYLFAAGAAAAAIQKHPLQIVPRSHRMKGLDAVLLKAVATFSIVLLLGGIGSYWVQEEKLSTIMALHSAREAMAALAETAFEKAEALAAIESEVRIKKDILLRLRQRHPPFQEMFQSLSELIPEEAFLKKAHIAMDKGQWVLEMQGLIQGENNFQRIDTFSEMIDHLEHSDPFFEVAMTPVENNPGAEEEMAFHVRTYFK